MKIDLFVSALMARYRLFLLIVAATVLTTTAVSLILPKTYIATVALLTDARDEQVLGNRLGPPPERERLGYLQTQVDILTGPQVARQVVTDLKLATEPAMQKEFQSDTNGTGSIEDWVAKILLRDVKVDTSQSSVIRLSYSTSNPEFAARVANAFAQAYLDTVLRLRTEPNKQASSWFNEQLKGLRSNLEQAQKRLAQYQQEKGIVSADERYDIENSRLSELVTRVARNQGTGNEAATAELARAEASLREMSSDLGPMNPQLVRQKAIVNGLRERLANETRNAAADDLGLSRRARNARLVAAMEAQRDKVLQLKVARSELAVLGHDVELAQRAYDDAMQRQMASGLESRASQTNVSILDPAAVPNKPTRPRVLLNIALSVVVGILLAMTVVYLLEMFDQRVRWLSDLDSDPQVPLLGVLNKWDGRDGPLLGSSYAHPALPRLG
ncbi:MAG TPA: GNVR domain-containing protein [Azospira sp.]|nr:GNVR domain-containing protein [Azospira sp.]